MAATFAPSNADIFVDLMIDWDKLLDAIQSMLGMFAGAAAAGAGNPQPNGGLQASGAQGADLLAMAEASLGFSIKHDLVPTLGNELAITLSGFNSVSMPTAASVGQTGNATAKRSSPRFLLVLAVRDEVKFEKLLVRLLNGPTGSAGQPLARTLYRGATINSRKDVAYAITSGFLLAGGSPAEIRRAIDAHALGSSLASAAEFRQAFDGSRPTTLRAYLSSRLSKDLYDSLLKETAKSGAGSEEAVAGSQTSSPIALSMIPDEDGLMIEARVPTNLALLALSSMFNAKPAPYGISPSRGIGASDSASPRTGGRATPRLTDDDLRSRRP
jgi:hypothetical protein